MTSFLYGDFLWFPGQCELISYSSLTTSCISLSLFLSPPSSPSLPFFPHHCFYTVHCPTAAAKLRPIKTLNGLFGPSGPPPTPISLLSLFLHGNGIPYGPQHTVGCFTSTPGQAPSALQSLSGALHALRRFRWPLPPSPPPAGSVSSLGSQADRQPLPTALSPALPPILSHLLLTFPQLVNFSGQGQGSVHLYVLLSSQHLLPNEMLRKYLGN